MESTLEVLVEKVLATEEGDQDLWSKLLDVTTTVKSHNVIIQQLEEHMNELESQMAAQTTENNMDPMQDIVENDIFKWKIEEEVVGELIADVFLKGEELAEVHHMCSKANRQLNRRSAMSKRESPVHLRYQPEYLAMDQGDLRHNFLPK
ncbi:hypothetical protein HAX54_040954 [Datura stramonium]|uniref:Uncharacterized protein n=1 Tax=Datura stramonium TaxID=4076 RepID=A0ABS8VNA5_DATST|nr:hypothetical protein [Datura stramonium]